MKIQPKKTAIHVVFSSLVCGNTFREVESNSNVIWMKTSRIEDDEGNVYNAVDLSDGYMDTFENDEEVVPVTITAVEE